jgi:hypothetical protein
VVTARISQRSATAVGDEGISPLDVHTEGVAAD